MMKGQGTRERERERERERTTEGYMRKMRRKGGMGG